MVEQYGLTYGGTVRIHFQGKLAYSASRISDVSSLSGSLLDMSGDQSRSRLLSLSKNVNKKYRLFICIEVVVSLIVGFKQKQRKYEFSFIRCKCNYSVYTLNLFLNSIYDKTHNNVRENNKSGHMFTLMETRACTVYMCGCVQLTISDACKVLNV